MTTRTFALESGTSEDGLRLIISDETSCEVVAHVQLDPTQIFTLMKGGSIKVDGRMSDHLDRVGKTLVVEQVDVPREITDGINFRDRDAKLHAGKVWAEGNHPGWDTYSPRHTNTATVRVVLRKWVSP